LQVARPRFDGRIVLLALLALLAALPAREGGAQTQDCSVSGENAFVHDTLEDIYFWYRELPDTSPALYPSPEAYLDAVRYRPLDATFSYISDKVADAAFFSDSQFVGFGLATQVVNGSIRVADVFEGSPADLAGLARGDTLLAVNDRSAAEILAGGGVGAAFGPSEIGFVADVLFLGHGGIRREARMVKTLVTIPTVSAVQVYDVGAERVGYLLFRNFVGPSDAALDAAFERLRAAGATRLVLDLRYNGGGLISVAQHLASLIGGPRLNGKVMLQFVHNDKHAELDTVYRFEDAPQALAAKSLVVVATRATASASELIVNSLRPFMNVTVVGDATFGKPVGQYGYDFCDKILHPVAFALRNVLGKGDYYKGIPSDCAAADDLNHLMGDPAEASLAEALHFVATGSCSGAGPVRSSRRPTRLRPTTGLQQLIGAY
jgi:carboxyl-terminal processing protease